MWSDLSETAYRIAPRVNAAIVAVPAPGPDAADTRAPVGGRIILYGGDDGTNPRNDLWVYDVAARVWEQPEGLKGDPPSARSRHTLTLVRYVRPETQKEEDRIYLYGGVGTLAEDVMYLDMARRSWELPRAIGEKPMPLLGHTAAQVRGAWCVVCSSVRKRTAECAYTGS